MKLSTAICACTSYSAVHSGYAQFQNNMFQYLAVFTKLLSHLWVDDSMV